MTDVVAPLATDVPLSGIPLGQTPSYYYGLDGSNLSKRFNTSAVLNVADFPGVDRNGSADSYAGIQACFDLAFGSKNAPHGNGGKNRPVYFPVGNYKVLTPLQLTAVWSGKIFGDGLTQSSIGYAGPLTPVNAEGWVPTLWLNGFNYGEISNIFFSGPADPTNKKTVCLWWGPDGVNGGSSAHGNLISNVGTGGQAAYGIIHGSAASAANSENTYLNCTLFGIHDFGIFLSGANTLNMRWIGGAIDSCKTGIKTNNAATIPIIDSPAFANNVLDIDLAASGRTVISGIRTESGQLLRANTAATLINCHGSIPGDRVVGSVSGTTLTVTSLGAKGAIVFPGSLVFGPGLTNQYNSQDGDGSKGMTRIVAQLTGSSWGIGTYQLSKAGSVPGGTTLAIAGMFLELQGAASLNLIDCGSDNDQCIVGDNNSRLFIRGNQWFSSNDGGIAPHLIAAYSGVIEEYDASWGGGTNLVANLPTPRANLKGIRLWVSDSSVTTFGTPVAAGGSNAVPVWCDGSAWKVG